MTPPPALHLPPAGLGLGGASPSTNTAPARPPLMCADTSLRAPLAIPLTFLPVSLSTLSHDETWMLWLSRLRRVSRARPDKRADPVGGSSGSGPHALCTHSHARPVHLPASPELVRAQRPRFGGWGAESELCLPVPV